MKKILIILLAVSVLAAAAIAMAGVSGTRHDLRTGTALEPCAFCHTPHGGNNTVAPLWNRSQVAQTYSLYTSTSFNMGSGGTTNALDKGSAPCMVCHNGVPSALINYPGRGSTANTAYNFTMPASAATFMGNVGTDLQNDHPVSFTYNATLDVEANNFPTASGGTIPGAINYPLFAVPTGSAGTQFSCASCHAVHHTPVATYATGTQANNQVYFLRSSNAGSALCLGCHRNR